MRRSRDVRDDQYLYDPSVGIIDVSAVVPEHVIDGDAYSIGYYAVNVDVDFFPEKMVVVVPVADIETL